MCVSMSLAIRPSLINLSYPTVGMGSLTCAMISVFVVHMNRGQTLKSKHKC